MNLIATNSKIESTSNTVKDMSSQEQTMHQEQIVEFVDDLETTMVTKEGISDEHMYSDFAHDNMTHDVKAILERPVKISTFTLDGTSGPVDFKFPSALFNASPNLRNKLDYFTYFKAKLHLRVMFNTTPFQLGKYWMCFSPYEDYSGRPFRPNLMNITGYPGVEIDLATGKPVELSVPFVSPLSHMNLITGEGTYGTLRIARIVGLSSGTSGDTAQATLYAWFTDVELSMPTNAPANYAAFTAQIYTPESNDVKPTSILARMASPGLEWVKNMATSALNTIGYCKQTLPVLVDRIINLPAFGFTNMNGVDTSVKLAADEQNSLMPDPKVFGTSIDEMDIKYICSRMNIPVDPIPWNVTATNGTALAVFPVNPGFCKTVGTLHNPTQLAFVASMFAKWRGTLKYRISVAKTAFHTGRLQIVYKPAYQSTVVNTDLESAYNWILDLSQSSEITVEIPYISNVLYQDVALYDTVTATTPTNGTLTLYVLNELRATSPSVSSEISIVPWIAGGDDIEFAIPDFNQYVPINTPATFTRSAEELTGEKFEAQIKDYKCTFCGRYPEDRYECYPDCPRYFQKEPRFEAQIFNAGEVGETKEVSLIKGHKVDPLVGGKLGMGEKITNLRCLTRRFGIVTRGASFPYFNGTDYATPGPYTFASGVASFIFNTLNFGNVWFGTLGNNILTKAEQVPIGGTSATPLTASAPIQEVINFGTPINYISTLYRFYRGGRRFKFVTPEVRDYNTFNLATSTNATPGLFTNNNTGITSEFTRDPKPWTVFRRRFAQGFGPKAPEFENERTAGVVAPASATFRTVAYPDITGVIEVETPYYSKYPVSVITETNPAQAGPLGDSSVYTVRRGKSSEDCVKPVYFAPTAAAAASPFVATNALHTSMGAVEMYAASSDDFSFGYLVGAQPLIDVA